MSCTITEETYGSMKKIKFDWTIASSSSGAAAGTTTKAYNGKIEYLVTIPDASTAPSASYDIVINDQDSTDVLNAQGANRAAAATEIVATSMGVVANDTLSIAVSNAGSSTAGVAYLYLR